MAKQTFTTGQVLTAAQVNALQANDFNQTVSVKTANYVLAATDKGTRIEFNTSGSVTCTVNSGLFDAGDTLVIQNRGAGTATITAGTATVNSSASLAVTQYSAGILYFISDSAALFFGDAAGISATAFDAKGDLLVGTGSDTFTRLPVSSTNFYTLVADSSTATGLAYAAPASSGALTLISTTTLSSVASQSFNSVFTSTYRNYQVFINLSGTHSGTNLLAFRFRASSTDATSSYQSRLQSLNTNAAGSTSFDYNDQSSVRINLGYLKWNSDPELSGLINVTNPQVAQTSGVSGIMTSGDYFGVAPVSSLSMGILSNTTVYDGFTLFPTGGGNLNGVVSIYGVSK
jgi:hypothetical protein